MQTSTPVLRVLIHAPTAGALNRARNNAANLRAQAPHAEVRIVANAEGVAAALDTPRPDTDGFTLLCANTLKRLQRSAPAPFSTVPVAILALVTMQQEGWCYVRA